MKVYLTPNIGLDVLQRWKLFNLVFFESNSRKLTANSQTRSGGSAQRKLSEDEL